MQFHGRTTHTHNVENVLCTSQSLRNYYIKYDHRAQCLSPIQVAPGHVNAILTMDTERFKPENPDLKR